MFAQLRTAFLMLLFLTILTGGVYPLVVTLISQAIFPHQANGSLMVANGRIVGSELIGQAMSEPKYFWGRLSATSLVPDNAAASSGSNFGPLHPKLLSTSEERINQLNVGDAPANKIPVDLVTASGSGLDPHISPAAAEFQVSRVATARGMSEDQVRKLIAANTQGRQLGVLGEPCVHVLRLNLALDQQHSVAK